VVYRQSGLHRSVFAFIVPFVFAFGVKQVIVQNYNLMFTLGHLAQLSDGVLAIENDQMGAVCREVKSSSNNIQKSMF
jgi:hypothetical protein